MKRILLFCFTIFTFLASYAETYWNYNPYTTEDTLFYVTFMMNGGDNDSDGKLEFYLYASTRNTSVKDVTITVTNPSTKWETAFTCNYNTVGKVSIPNTEGYLSDEDTVMQRGLIVKSTAPISLYASNYGSLSYGATNILPVKALSKEYVIQTYSYDVNATEFAVVATKDGTKISIDPKKNNIKKRGVIGVHYTGPFVIELNEGEAYLLRGEGKDINIDLSGTVICSNHPIAVFNGGQSAVIPDVKGGEQDHIVEQSLPTYMWGKEFIVTNSVIQDFNIVKITAMYDNTILYIDNQQEIVLNKRESFQFAMGNVKEKDLKRDSTKIIKNKDVLYINTSYPTICFSYHTDRGENGDPSMIFIPPLEQRIDEISFLTHDVDNAETEHYVNIVTKTTDVDKIELDSNDISGFLTIPGNSLYSYVRKKLNEGSHKIISRGDGFLAYAYGAQKEDYESYGYNVGNTLLPMGAYMLIEGKRVNEMSFCFNDVIDIKGIINYEYSNIDWYLDLKNEPNTAHFSGKNNEIQIPIPNYYDTTGVYEIKMVVTKTSPLCSGSDITGCADCGHTQDTVYAKLRIFDTYNLPSTTQYICKGDSFHWQLYEKDIFYKDSLVKDTFITTAGIFIETLKSVNDCDSVITLITKEASQADTICNIVTYDCKLPYVFNDNLDSLTQEGVYYDTLQTIHGCDSVVIVNFKVYPCYEESDTICLGTGVYNWENHGIINTDTATTKYKPGQTYTFEDTLDVDLGKGKGFYTLNLYIAPIYVQPTDTIEMCDNDSSQWKGHKNDTIFKNIKAGTYIIYDSLKTVGCNCDSIHKLVLIVYPTSLQMDTREICLNDTFPWRGKNISYSVPGTYFIYDTVATDFGCQSIYGLEVIVHPTYETVSDSIICEKDTLVWEGDTYVNLLEGDTILEKRYPTQNGCDSIFKLNLYVAPTYHKDTTAYICERDSFYWDVTQRYYYQDSVYHHRENTIFGCDSTFKLTLILKPVSDKDTVVRVCDCKLPYSHPSDYPKLKNLTIAGVYSDTLQSKLTGCDSILNLELIIDSCYLYPMEKDTVCINKLQDYKWENHDSVVTDFIYRFDTELGNKSGLYIISDSNKTIYGCDSVYTLELYVAPIYHKDTTAYICERDSFYWDVTQRYYYQDSVYHHRENTIFGCDSTFKLTLILKPVSDKDTVVRVCDCKLPYSHPSDYPKLKNLTIAGVYSDTLQSKLTGCDSILNLELIIDSCYLYPMEKDTVCINKLQDYKWENHDSVVTDFIYRFDAELGNKSGLYIISDSNKTIYGCDSVYTLELYVAPIYHKDTTAYICERDSFYWDVTQRYYYQDSVYHHRENTIFGCDSTFTLNLILKPVSERDTVVHICDCKLPYNHPSDYPKLKNLTVASVYSDTLQSKLTGCDSILNLTLIIDSCYIYPLEKDTVCINKLKEYEWKDHEDVMTQFISTFDSLSAVNGGTYTISDPNLTVAGCDSVYTLELYVAPVFHKDTTAYICERDSFYWSVTQRYYYKDSVYHHRENTIFGCDSTFTLNLILKPVSERDTVVHICDCKLPYNHPSDYPKLKNLTVASVYSDTLQSKLTGCDSILNLTLIIDSCYIYPLEKDTVCINKLKEYEWKDHEDVMTQFISTFDSLSAVNGGTYTISDPNLTVAGCDSVYTLELYVAPVFHKDTTAYICERDSFYWSVTQRYYYKDSIYHHRENTIFGCDSTFTLNLILKPVSERDTVVHICDCKLPYNHPSDYPKLKNLTVASVYSDTLQSKLTGCDSILNLTLIIDSCYIYPLEKDTVCINKLKEYEWKDHEDVMTQFISTFDSLSAVNGGTYTISDPNLTVAGCDSVYTLELYVAPVFHKDTTAYICERDSFYWSVTQRYYYKDSIYHHRENTIFGCDSTFTLNLILKPVSERDTVVHICDCKLPYNHPSDYPKLKNLTVASVYSDTLQSKLTGCDSILNLTLIIDSCYIYPLEKDTVCINKLKEYEWKDHEDVMTQFISTFDSLSAVNGGTYTISDPNLTVAGCDSVYTLELYVAPVFHKDTTAYICERDSFYWSVTQRYYYKDSIYHHRENTIFGCDSTFTLNLILKPVSERDTVVHICDCKLPYNHPSDYPKLKNLTVASVYSDTLQSKLTGCDSILNLTLIIDSCYIYPLEKDTVCINKLKEYEWKDHEDVMTQFISTFDSLSAVNGGTYTISDPNLTVAGCDSVYTLELYVAPVFHKDTTAYICERDSFYWSVTQRYYYKDSIYHHRENTIFGCDSTFTLNLILKPVSERDTVVHICDCKLPYNHPSDYPKLKNLTVASVYSDTLQSKLTGCDSILNLTLIIDSCYIYPLEKDTVCINKLKEYEWKDHEDVMTQFISTFDSLSAVNGGTYTISDPNLTVAGCDSVYTLELYVAPVFHKDTTAYICERDSFYWSVTQRYYYKDSVYHHRENTIFGCDSTFTLNLIVNPVYEKDTVARICSCKLPYNHPSDYPKLKNLTAAGVYSDTLFTIHGCDSILNLTLIVDSCYEFIERDSICFNKLPYIWEGHDSVEIICKNADTTYVFYDSLKTIKGCDSVYVLKLFVQPIYEFPTYYNLCDNKDFVWRGEKIDKNHLLEHSGGIEQNPYIQKRCAITDAGCDSCFVLYVTLCPTYLFEKVDTICSNQESYMWRGFTYTDLDSAGTYVFYDSLKTKMGCDSVYQLTLHVNTTYLFVTNDTICKKEDLYWSGKTYSNFVVGDTILWDSLLTVNKPYCDSVYQLNLHINPTYEDIFVDTVCDNALPYRWREKDYTTTGVYFDSLTSVYGCDSVYVLDLLVTPTYHYYDTIVICDNEEYTWERNGKEYGPYVAREDYYTETVRFGTKTFDCDSIWELKVKVHTTYLFERDTIICEDVELQWRGKEYNNLLVGETILWDSLKTVESPYCDSIYKLIVYVKPTYEDVRVDTVCDNNLPYKWRNREYIKTGVYYDSLMSVYGCDSVYVLDLLVTPTYHYYDTIVICDNEEYTWERNGKKYGPYVAREDYYTEIVRFGTETFDCDSIWELKVKVHPTYLFKEEVVICADEKYIWRNDTLENLQSGPCVFYDSLKTYLGCDSVYQLDLMVNPTYFFLIDTAICSNEVYNFNGAIIKDSGFYTDSLKTQNGCDSVYHLNLTVNPITDTIIYDTLCKGDIYYFGKQELKDGGYYIDTTLNEYGCQQINHLYLTLIDPDKFDVTILDACADDEYLIIPYTYEGRRPIAYSVRFDEDAREQRFEDVDYAPIDRDSVLLVDIPRDPADRRVYPRPDYYKATIFLHNGICSDTLIRKEEKFLIKYPSWITEQHWNDVISLLNDRYNGGYTFSRYQWFHNGVPMPGEDSSYIYQPLIMGDEYYAELTRTDDGKTIATCPIYPSMVVDSVIPYPYAEVIPNIVSGSYPYAEIKSVEKGQYWILDMLAIPKGPYEFEPPVKKIELPRERGMYIIVFKTTEHDRRHIQRVIVK